MLDRVTEIAPPKKGADPAAALATIRSEFPQVTDFERDFPSLCFALATGVGKTSLMGAFISYLHLARGADDFFVLAPNLAIYQKPITDFTPNTPQIVTGDNYAQRDPRSGLLFGGVRINIFNISKINSEVRGGKSPRIATAPPAAPAALCRCDLDALAAHSSRAAREPQGPAT
jgi:type III restriction enzyme